MTHNEADDSLRPRRWPAAAAITVAVLVAAVGVTTATGLPLPEPFRRFPAPELRALADRIDQACRPRFVSSHATVNWLSSRVDFPMGVPTDLAEHERAMLGTGSKVGCIPGNAIGVAIR